MNRIYEFTEEQLAKHDTEVGAKALRDAADEMDREGGWETPQWWLRERADDIARATTTTEVGT